MAKVKGEEQAVAAIKAQIQAALSNDKILKEMGEVIVLNTKATARKGKNPTTLEKYPPLKASTIKSRMYREKSVATSEFYRAKRSNMTFTGQLIDSIKFEIVRAGNRLRLFIKASGSRNDSKLTNAQLEKIHRDSRPVLGISNKVVDILANILKRHLRRALVRRRK